jgi:hypothetical protein
MVEEDNASITKLDPGAPFIITRAAQKTLTRNPHKRPSRISPCPPSLRLTGARQRCSEKRIRKTARSRLMSLEDTTLPLTYASSPFIAPGLCSITRRSTHPGAPLQRDRIRLAGPRLGVCVTATFQGAAASLGPTTSAEDLAKTSVPYLHLRHGLQHGA